MVFWFVFDQLACGLAGLPQRIIATRDLNPDDQEIGTSGLCLSMRVCAHDSRLGYVSRDLARSVVIWQKNSCEVCQSSRGPAKNHERLQSFCEVCQISRGRTILAFSSTAREPNSPVQFLRRNARIVRKLCRNYANASFATPTMPDTISNMPDTTIFCAIFFWHLPSAVCHMEKKPMHFRTPLYLQVACGLSHSSYCTVNPTAYRSNSITKSTDHPRQPMNKSTSRTVGSPNVVESHPCFHRIEWDSTTLHMDY